MFTARGLWDCLIVFVDWKCTTFGTYHIRGCCFAHVFKESIIPASESVSQMRYLKSSKPNTYGLLMYTIGNCFGQQLGCRRCQKDDTAGDTVDEFGWDNKHGGINVLLSKVYVNNNET